MIEFSNALERFGEVLHRDIALDDIVLDASIQRLEFTFECLWKLIKTYLKE
ncbi:MAG: nucleotidyltransferase substrate binding protein [Cytophagales bacterium]